jgi:hypothetical protein
VHDVKELHGHSPNVPQFLEDLIARHCEVPMESLKVVVYMHWGVC